MSPVKSRPSASSAPNSKPLLTAAALPSTKGTYLLFITLARSCSITVGGLGALAFEPGLYFYVGSAFGPGGLRARLSHHLRVSPRPHWHIDYLRASAEVAGIWYCPSAVRLEHQWAAILPTLGRPIPRFGSSDCRCPSHLFWLPHALARSGPLEVVAVAADLTAQLSLPTALPLRTLQSHCP